MPSIFTGYNYDIFISYRQNDNKYDGWVTEFVANLNKELEATIKDKLIVYFDANPHDGLLETHSVEPSLEDKLRCLIFIPILSRTYCDPKGFAWNNEFLAFLDIAKEDNIGLNVKLSSGNVASRVLPIRIHDLNPEDITLVKSNIGVIRSVDFIYKSSGVNRPLRANEDHPHDNVNKIYYRDQINKVANAIDEIIRSLKMAQTASKALESKHDQSVSQDLKEDKKREADEYKRGKSRRWLIIALSTLLCIVGVVALYKVIGSGKQVENVSTQDKSIAVLPFINDSPDKDNDYFCNGMMEEILNQLQKIGDLKVKARTTSEKYRNPNKDITQIGKELKVSLIMEGSVRKIGDDIRINAQLIDAKTGDHLWSEIYDGKYTTALFEFQSSVAKKVAASLNALITPKEEKNINQKPAKKIKAYDFILQANEMLRKWRYTNDSIYIKLTLALADQALKIDPEYLYAFQHKAVLFSEMRKFDSVWFYIKKMEDIDPKSYRIAIQKGTLYYYSNEPDSAIKYINQSIESAPKDEFYKWICLNLGQTLYYFRNDLQGALINYQKAYDNDGNVEPEINSEIAFLHYTIGDYQKALQYYNEALVLSAECSFAWQITYCFLCEAEYAKAFNFLDSIGSITTCGTICDLLRSYAYVNLKEYSKAEEIFKSVMNSGYKQTVDDGIYLGCIYNATGRKKEAVSVLQKIIESDEALLAKESGSEIVGNKTAAIETRISIYRLATAYAMIGDNKKALEYMFMLEKFGPIEYPVVLKTFPGFDNLRNDPEFKAIVKRIEDKKASLRAQAREMELRGEIDL